MIEARALTKQYGPVRAVDGVSLTVQRGELVGFLGPNGAGKSTTMKMLTGCLWPDAGEVRIGGEPVLGRRLEGRAQIGYLPEHTPLYTGMRVDRYLAFVAGLRGVPRGQRREATARVIDSCDLHGYATRRIATLSKGYRQRVGLAQALVSDPAVLVLDEPTSGLDPGEIVRIRELVTELARDKTILLSTHVLPEVEEVCQRVLILAAGKLVADGTPAELAADLGERVVAHVGAGAESLARLRDLPGVSAVEALEAAEGTTRAALEVDDSPAVAARVAELARDAGWPLFELRHDVPTLEQVFLARTRGLIREGERA